MADNSKSLRGRISTVSFKCKYFTDYGSSLFVVGNLKLLGNWDINNAVALSTTPNDYPVWFQRNAFSCPVGTEIVYKYFIKDIDGKITWENLPNNENRKKIISKPGEFVIYDEKNKIGEDLEQNEKYNSPINDIKPEPETPPKKKSKKKGKKKTTKKKEDGKKEDKNNKGETER